MLFNSLQFLLFFIVVFFLYWFVFNKSLRKQNLLLLVSSYFFYGCWDWRFLFLLIFSTFLDYFSGLMIDRSETQAARRTWLLISVLTNLGFLGFFKYYNFFAHSMADFLQLFGFKANLYSLSIILPVGISFYTFHGLSYVFDIYNRKIKPTTNWVDYSVFVSFFPLLVAGPIERATHLLPQIEKPRYFDTSKAIDGLRQTLWGLFKKIVIADTCAGFVDQLWGNYTHYSGSTLLLGAIMFSFQVYGDFSGYSDIALGLARLLGVELLRNFSYPFFSRNVAEFWRRWHISLSSWFRDYLYIPLGGSKGSKWKRARNVFIIFIVSGFWHGASWTRVTWGFMHAVFIMPSVLLNTNRQYLGVAAQGRLLPSLREFFSIIFTFLLTTLALTVFRAPNLPDAFHYIGIIFSRSFFTIPQPLFKTEFLLLLVFMVIEWLGREEPYAIAKLGQTWRTPGRWSFYYLLLFLMYLYSGKPQQFIYFQF